MTDTRSQLSPVTVVLHWVIGLAMIGMVLFGMWMADLPKEYPGRTDLYALHKSIGVLVLVFATWRLVRRIGIGMLQGVGDYAAWEKVLSKLVAGFLLFATLALPLSGIAMTVYAARPIAVFGVPVLPQLIAERNKGMGDIFHGAHELLGWAVLGLVTLHILGALKHHFVDGDGTLKRMLGARVQPVD